MNQTPKKLRHRLRIRYRMVVLNDDSFDEVFAFRLTPLRILVLLGAVTLVMTFLVISLVAFTPLREYIPGYGSTDERKQVLEASMRIDTLSEHLKARDWYIQNLEHVLSGKKPQDDKTIAKDSGAKYNQLNLKPGEEDALLRQEIEDKNKFALNKENSKERFSAMASFIFFNPVQGKISSSFNVVEKHYGVDIAATENEPIKATLDGTVIFTGWSSQDGYVMQIQHGQNVVSIYKHASGLNKHTGDFVKAGEPIGIVGNTGELAHGPHLHFEIWFNGMAVNPQEYLLY